jgi:uncharacterized lipoprotein YddW (UPF0748 family)
MRPHVRWMSAALIVAALGGWRLLAQEPEVRGLWVDSFNPGLRAPAEVDALIARAKRGNLNTIFAQVRRNAQTLYANSVEGWIESYVPPAGFDPLQDLITKAHAEGIEVHAWVNIGPVYTGHPLIATASWPCMVPCDPAHVFNQHGWGQPTEDYWLTRTHPSFTAGTIAPFTGERLSTGQWWIDLGHPAAAQYTLATLLQLVSSYDVDGLHLDFIRYPEMPITRPPTGGLSFATGYNPVSVRRFNATYGRIAGTLPDPWDASWSQWRRDQVRACVRRLYLEMISIRPQARLSAALITFFRGPNQVEPRTFQQTEAYYRVFQDWDGWMREGILDWSIPMIYKSHHLSSHLVQFNEWTEFTRTAQYGRHGVIGLGAFMNSVENTIVQIAAGRAPALNAERTRGFNFFSYNATNQAIAGVPLRPQDEFFRALSEDGAYAAEAPFPVATTVPAMSWKTSPRKGHLLAQIRAADGAAADGALIEIHKVGGGPADETILQYADGNGYVGGVDLNPGAYQLLITVPGEPGLRATVPQPVVPGRVTRMVVRLGHPFRGPMLRSERVLGAHERVDHLTEASDLDQWQTRDPMPEDILANRIVRPPE